MSTFQILHRQVDGSKGISTLKKYQVTICEDSSLMIHQNDQTNRRKDLTIRRVDIIIKG